MRFYAPVLLFGAFCTLCAAQDVVRLRSGGELTGRVIAQTPKVIVLEMASGEFRVAASDVEAVERGRGDAPGPKRIVHRDEWFFLLKDERIVGWRRFLRWEQGDRIQVEERRVMFADRSDHRRVEIAQSDGTPLEYLWIVSSPGDMSVWSGQIKDGRHVRQTRRNGTIETATTAWTTGVQLPLIARAGVPVFDPKLNRVDKVDSSERWSGRALSTISARVERATRLFAPVDVRTLAKDATLHPLTPRPEDRLVHHLAGGVTLSVPHERWVETKQMRSEGEILTVENRITFARVEIETERIPGQTVAIAARRGRTRVAMEYDHVGALGGPVIEGNVSQQRLEIRRGTERWQAILRIEVRADRTITTLALAPVRIWIGERASLERILASMKTTD